MTKRLIKVLGVVLAAGAFAVGCSTDRSPLAPPIAAAPALQPAAQPSNSLLGGIVGGLLGTLGKLVNVVVSVLERPTPLARDVRWSFDAGPGGALSGNREVGLSIAIPPGALDRTVRITVTARQGKVIDYHFEPEGLQFAKPVVLTQDVSSNSFLGGLADLLGGRKTLKGAYYAAPTLQYDPRTGMATVNEFEPTVSAPNLGFVSFQIRHFSGYTVAMCESDTMGFW
jgi:hypothetical protein